MAQARRRLPPRRRVAVAALSVAGHIGVLLAVLSAQSFPPRPVEDPPIQVALVVLPQPPPADVIKLPEPAPPVPVQPPPPPRVVARKMPTPPRDVPPRVVADVEPGPTSNSESRVSDAQLASAATAGSGSGGGACNMTRRLQNALRKDRLVLAAVSEAADGKAIMVWNGDWVRHGAQDGAGLAAVREAILWEVAFAPAECRAEPVQGLVAISLNDGSPARLVVGSGHWRWSDMLFSHRGRR